MVKPLQSSIGSAFAANTPVPIRDRGTKLGTDDNAEIRDTITLSVAALVASRSSNLLAHTPNDGAFVLGEFPLEALIERGYSASQISIDLGIPTQTLDAALDIQTFYIAA